MAEVLLQPERDAPARSSASLPRPMPHDQGQAEVNVTPGVNRSNEFTSLNAQFHTIARKAKEEFIGVKLQDLIIKRSFNVGSVYNGNTTALHVACGFGNLQLVNMLLDQYSHLGTKHHILRGDGTDWDTAVHSAAIGGNLNVVRKLESTLDDPVTVHGLLNKYGHTPLHSALGKGSLQVANHWMRRLADPQFQEVELNRGDWTGATPFHFAARNGQVELLELFQAIHIRHRKVLDLDQRSTAGLTALHYAAWNGKVDAVRWLVDQGCNIENGDDVEWNTALHWAAMRRHREVVELLVRAHVRRGSEVFMKNKHRDTVLDLMELHSGAEDLPALLDLFDNEGLLDLKAFPDTVLVKYVMGYGSAEQIGKLKSSLRYAQEKKVQEYMTALRKLLNKGSLAVWLAERGNKDSVSLLMELEKELGLAFSPTNMGTALHRALLGNKTEFADALANHPEARRKPSQPALLPGNLPGNTEETRTRQGTTQREGGTSRCPGCCSCCGREAGQQAAPGARSEPQERLHEWLSSTTMHLTTNANSLLAKLSSKEKAVFGNDADSLAEEIPLAFWVHEAGEAGSKVERFMEHHQQWGAFINGKGKLTGRTALHWAYIFDRRTTIDKLSGIKERQDLPDKNHKYPRSYAVESRKEDRNVFADALKTVVVGAALIGNISFSGFMQQDQPYPHNSGIKGFWISNSISFFLAMGSALGALIGMLPMPDVQLDDEVVVKVQLVLVVTSSLLITSIFFALVAFVTAGLSRPVIYRKYAAGSWALGGLICAAMLVWFVLRLVPLFPKKATGSNMSSTFEDEEHHSGDVEEPARGAIVAYKVGPRYAEYPWEDGLDELVPGRGTGLPAEIVEMSGTRVPLPERGASSSS